MWRCVSTMPGMTMPPDASISNAPSGASRPGPTPAMRSSITRTSVPSRTSWSSFIVSTLPRRRTTGRPGSGAGASGLMGAALLPVTLSLGWCTSRDQHHLRAAGGLPLALPRRLDVVERPAVHVDDDVPPCRVLRQAEVRVPLELGTWMGDREAADVERHGPEEWRGQGDLVAGDVADLHVTR